MIYQTVIRVIGLVTFLFSNLIYAQETDSLFKKEYSKLSLILQPSKLNGYSVSSDTAPIISFNNTFSPQFGFTYNFAQSKNFNFKTGILAKVYNPSIDIHLSDTSLRGDYDYNNDLTQFYIANQFVISEIFGVEYYYPITKKVNIVLGVGVSLDLRTGPRQETISFTIYDYDTSNFKTILKIETVNEQITSSFDVSMGLNYKTKVGLFQLTIFNNSQLLTYPSIGIYHFVNLNDNQNKTGIYTIKGNYFGLSLSISPKKGWLKSKPNGADMSDQR